MSLGGIHQKHFLWSYMLPVSFWDSLVGSAALIPFLGTMVGDPIETNAAGKVFSKGRDAQKLLRCVLVVMRS